MSPGLVSGKGISGLSLSFEVVLMDDCVSAEMIFVFVDIGPCAKVVQADSRATRYEIKCFVIVFFFE